MLEGRGKGMGDGNGRKKQANEFVRFGCIVVLIVVNTFTIELVAFVTRYIQY